MVETLRQLVDLGMTMQALANGIGTTRGTVNNWVKGTKNMSAESEVKVASYLNRLREQLKIIL